MVHEEKLSSFTNRQQVGVVILLQEGYNTSNNGAGKSPQKCMDHCQNVHDWPHDTGGPKGIEIRIISRIVIWVNIISCSVSAENPQSSLL